MYQIEHCTDEEVKLMEELKQRTLNDLTPKLLQDETLFYRFLKARDFNIDNAEKMLRNHLKERKIYGADTILTDYTPPEHMTTYWASNFVGFSKEGNIVCYFDVGGMDNIGVLKLWDYKTTIKHCTHFFEENIERTRQRSIKLGEPIKQGIVIVNMDKLTFAKATYKKAIDWSLNAYKCYQDNYPETAKVIYVINASLFFNMGYSIIKKCFAAALIQKIQIYGRTGWQEILLNEIDADVLPAFLGGNRTDPDGNPLCNTFIIHGSKVPEELYTKKKKKSIKNEKDVKSLTVSRMSCTELKFDIDVPDTCIEWTLETKNKDISFGLYYKDHSKISGEMEELIPKQRVDTMLSCETGIFKCSKTGTYIMLFDNSYSWIYSKEIYYIIHLVKPQENDT